jgi:hypothetical protein
MRCIKRILHYLLFAKMLRYEMYLLCNYCGIQQRRCASSFSRLHAIAGHSFGDELATCDGRILLRRTLDDYIGSSLIEECEGISRTSVPAVTWQAHSMVGRLQTIV